MGNFLCKICGKAINIEDKIVDFPVLTENELNPLYFFNASGFHKECFDKHPLKQKVIDRMAEIEARPHPSQMTCYISGKKMTMENIGDPDNHVSVGNLTNDSKHPLYKYNDIELNKMYLSNWEDIHNFLALLRDLETQEKNEFKKKRLNTLLLRLTTPAREPIKPEIMERLKERRRREGKEQL